VSVECQGLSEGIVLGLYTEDLRAFGGKNTIFDEIFYGTSRYVIRVELDDGGGPEAAVSVGFIDNDF
jgi:hypothetical protein